MYVCRLRLPLGGQQSVSCPKLNILSLYRNFSLISFQTSIHPPRLAIKKRAGYSSRAPSAPSSHLATLFWPSPTEYIHTHRIQNGSFSKQDHPRRVFLSLLLHLGLNTFVLKTVAIHWLFAFVLFCFVIYQHQDIVFTQMKLSRFFLSMLTYISTYLF